MNDLSQGELQKSISTEVDKSEFSKLVNIGDTIEHTDTSVSVVTRKVYVEKVSGNFEIKVYSQRQ
jgi:hypothetical protein